MMEDLQLCPNADVGQHTICRTCKSPATNDVKILSIFSTITADFTASIDAMLLDCTSIRIEAEDRFPKVICSKCVDQLRAAYSFRLQCQRTDNQWRQLRLVAATVDGEESDPTKDEHCGAAPSKNELHTGCVASSAAATDDHLSTNDRTLLMGETLHSQKSAVHRRALFKCSFCDKRYSRKTCVRRHEATAHTQHRKVHMCRICGKTVKLSERLRPHLELHLKEKPFQCCRCARGFTRHDHLGEHEKCCTGVPKLVCNVCNRTFCRQDSFETHLRRHDTDRQLSLSVVAAPLPTPSNIDHLEMHYVEIDMDAVQQKDADGHLEDSLCSTSVSPASSLRSFPSSAVEENVATEQELMGDQKSVFESNFQVELKSDCELNRAIAEEEEDGDDKEEDSLLLRNRKQLKKSPSVSIEVSEESLTASAMKANNTIEATVVNGCRHRCVKCEEQFVSMRKLESHVRHKHAGLRMHICTVCNKQFTLHCHLRRHMRTHSVKKPFQCDVCQKCFTRKDNMRNHQKTHSAVSNRRGDFKCDLCDRILSRSDLLRRHIAVKHGETVRQNGKLLNEEGGQSFKCDECQRVFNSKQCLSNHVKTQCHSVSASMKLLQCDICQKCFKRKKNLNEHRLSHSGTSRTFLCSECGKSFVRRENLVIHMRRHTGEKPFKCQYCGKGFPRTADLTVHERYHRGEKPHLCTECGRGFTRACSLTVHMRTHTGEKPYKCTYCDAAFAQGNDLKAHVRRHTGEQYQCNICLQSFFMAYQLSKHKRTIHGLNIVCITGRLSHEQKPPESNLSNVQPEAVQGPTLATG